MDDDFAELGPAGEALLQIGGQDMPVTYGEVRKAMNAWAHELAEKIRWREAPSDADRRFVAYVNGWCDGRNEAADEIDPEVQ